MKQIFLIITICCSTIFAVAQRPANTQQKDQLETERINFFNEKIGLTLDQNPKFWSLYNNYKKKNEALRKKERELREKCKTFTQDAEYTVAVKEFYALEKERFELKAEFHKEIERVLSPKQMFLFFDAEKQYKSLLIKKMNNITNSKTAQPAQKK